MTIETIFISGKMATGKSTLAARLAAKLEYNHFKTRDLLKLSIDPLGLGQKALSRQDLIDLGEALDLKTGGSWIVEGQDLNEVVLDCVRTPGQMDAIRQKTRPNETLHVHLRGENADIRARFMERSGENPDKYSASDRYDQDLGDAADLVINTSHCTADDVLVRVLAAVQYTNAQKHHQLVDVIVGGQYGSEGKGHVVSHIAGEYAYLVRVGGPNAGHTVLEPETGEKFSFYHIPAGALHSHAALVLGPGANIRIPILQKELKYARGLDRRLLIDPRANVITDDDIEQEAGVVKDIGSTGQGVGVATAGKILARGKGRTLAGDIPELKPYLRETLDILEEAYTWGRPVLLEGTQGTGLSLHHGPYPYVTSRDTTASGTAGEAGIPPRRIRRTIMVCRTNPIRVQSPPGGTSGPMGKETTWEEISARAGIAAETLREREKTTTTKRQRRVSEFDWALLRKAALLNAPTDLALTFVDYISQENTKARRFEQLTSETHKFIEEVERVAQAPVSLITTRFDRRSIIDRRSWR